MNVLIVGSGPQALFMLRVFSEVSDNIELVSLSYKVACYSNIPKAIYNFKSKYDLSIFIKEKINSVGLVCFAGGAEIQSMLEVDSDIFNAINVQPNKLDALTILSSKARSYKRAEELGINNLPSAMLSDALDKGINFSGPYILKWNEENVNPIFSAFKTKVFNDIDELIAFSDMFDMEACNKLIIQKYLKVGEGGNVSYLGYYARGKHLFGMLGQQLLQYPMGITAHLVEYKSLNSGEIINSAVSLIESTSFTGFGEVEFIIDPEDGNYYLLEVNPRPCGWSSAMLGKYENISSVIIDNSVEPNITSESVEWINVLRFLRSSLEIGSYNFLKALVKLPFIHCYDVFSLRDIKPFLSQFKSNK